MLAFCFLLLRYFGFLVFDDQMMAGSNEEHSLFRMTSGVSRYFLVYLNSKYKRKLFLLWLLFAVI